MSRSVHLTDWPAADDLPADDELVAAMDRCATSARPARRCARPRRCGRLPLSSLTVVVADAGRARGVRATSCADELNVKDVRLLDARPTPDAATFGVSQRLTVNARAAGPRLGKDVQTAIRASKSGDWSVSTTGEVTAGGLVLQSRASTPSRPWRAAWLRLRRRGCSPAAASSSSTPPSRPSSRPEGLARDVVRAVQQARRDAGLDVSDRIVVDVTASAAVADAARTHAALIERETLATTLAVHEADVESPVIELSRA